MSPAQRAPYDRALRQELQIATRALHRVADELDSGDGRHTERFEEALREAVDRQRQRRNERLECLEGVTAVREARVDSLAMVGTKSLKGGQDNLWHSKKETKIMVTAIILTWLIYDKR
jgi:hypothetical protein